MHDHAILCTYNQACPFYNENWIPQKFLNIQTIFAIIERIHGAIVIHMCIKPDSRKQITCGLLQCMFFYLSMQDVSPEELVEALPAHNPRYVAYSYCFTHDDGRISYPLIFVYFSPLGTHVSQRYMYVSTNSSKRPGEEDII